MGRETGHNGLAQIGQVVGEAGHLIAAHPGVDEQHAGSASHDDRARLHGGPSACDLQSLP
jgi:hypothetical protein